MSKPHSAAPGSPLPPPLPLVVQVGFSGSRLLSETSRTDSAPTRAWLAALGALLRHELQQLPQALGLSPQHFIVGISQLAVGADTLFTESMHRLQWPQRLLLPQSRAEFLQAGGSQGPDFLPHERLRAEALFDSPHVIEQAVVAADNTRNGRFDETNLHILAEADLLVCLRVQNPAGKVGGTLQLMQRAEVRGVPVLELVIDQDAQGLPRLASQWHRREKFRCPELPPALADIAPLQRTPGPGLPALAAYAERLANHTSTHANRLRNRFAAAAAVIVGTHVLATLVASGAMKAPHHGPLLIGLVILELILLGGGLWMHRQLHHRGDTSGWALSRLCEGIGLSAQALHEIPGAMPPRQALPFPRSLTPVLRTLTVLHLSIRATTEAFEEVRQRYLDSRLLSTESGQLAYYRVSQQQAEDWKRRADCCFIALSTLAIVSVVLKLVVTQIHGVGPLMEVQLDFLADLFGTWAISAPVLAVGAISLSGAFDLEARALTFREMHEYLAIQEKHVAQATSLRELAVLAAAIETRLLGETLTWYSRRVFTSVA